MVVHTNANAAIGAINAQGGIAKYTTAKPTATIFRYTSVQFTVFGQAWFFENFDKGAAAYLGETLTYTASRNCDLHADTLIQMDLPGLGNYIQTADSTGTSAYMEVMHPQLKDRYNRLAGATAAITHALDEHHWQLSDSATAAAGQALRGGSGHPHYTDGVALAAVKFAEYQLGGQRMDRVDKHALYTWHLLNNANVPYEMLGLARSREHNDLELKKDSMTFQRKYCPLNFSFCRHPSMALPLISNMYSNLVVQCELEPFSALIRNYSGNGNSGASTTSAVKALNHAGHADVYADTALPAEGGVDAITDGTQCFTLKRQYEQTLSQSRENRGRDLRVAPEQLDAAPSASHADVPVQADYPVSVVSRVFFLGPQERYAFASNAHCQVVEACQRVKHSITQQSSYTFRTDTLQNACSTMYVCPLYRPHVGANEYFDYGGAYDHIRQRSFPAITSIKFSTNGADLYAEADESFYRLVQPYAHHVNVAPAGRKVYPMNFGAKSNANHAPVQFMGAVNLSRSVNSQATIKFAANMWAAATGDSTDQGNPAASTSVPLEVEFVVWGYNVYVLRCVSFAWCAMIYNDLVTQSLNHVVFVLFIYGQLVLPWRHRRVRNLNDVQCVFLFYSLSVLSIT